MAIRSGLRSRSKRWPGLPERYWTRSSRVEPARVALTMSPGRPEPRICPSWSVQANLPSPSAVSRKWRPRRAGGTSNVWTATAGAAGSRRARAAPTTGRYTGLATVSRFRAATVRPRMRLLFRSSISAWASAGSANRPSILAKAGSLGRSFLASTCRRASTW